MLEVFAAALREPAAPLTSMSTRPQVLIAVSIPGFRLLVTTLAPSRASPTAMPLAAPIPEPVTTATRPSSRPVIRSFLSACDRRTDPVRHAKRPRPGGRGR